MYNSRMIREGNVERAGFGRVTSVARPMVDAMRRHELGLVGLSLVLGHTLGHYAMAIMYKDAHMQSVTPLVPLVDLAVGAVFVLTYKATQRRARRNHIN